MNESSEGYSRASELEPDAAHPASGSPTQPLTLDPADDAAWDRFAVEAHRILDDTLHSLRSLRASRAWQPMPHHVQAALRHAPAPVVGRSLAEVYAEIQTLVLPYTSANRHPRAWGWVRGQGSPEAMVADMIASALNAHVGGGFSAPVEVEATVIRWLAEALGMTNRGVAAGGLLTSGASMANLLALAVARAEHAPFDVREQGLSDGPRMCIYCSTETHGWARKAVNLLGLGRRSLRFVQADEYGKLTIPALARAVAEDRAAGTLPFAVIGNAGTVNTGAFDELLPLRRFCTDQGLWLHVDGAFGALLKLAPRYRFLVEGLELADSVAFDLHKWGSLPFGTGCLLVQDSVAHRRAFGIREAYLERESAAAGMPTPSTQRGMLSGELFFSDLGVESTRDFKALRVWMQLSVHGLRKHGALIEQNIGQAAYLERLVRDEPSLAMLAQREANIVCFCYRGRHKCRSQSERNALNREIVMRLQESGAFIVSGTTLAGGDFALRIAITNHRSRFDDVRELVRAVVCHGDAIVESPGGTCCATVAACS